MRLRLILATTVLFGLHSLPSFADPIDQVLARLTALEKRNEDLAEENAALKQRVSRLESGSSAVVAAVPPAKTPAPTAPIAIAPDPPVIATTSITAESNRQATAAATPRDLSHAAFSWTGMYAGLHAGGAIGDLAYADTVSLAPFVKDTFRGEADASGFLGGVQLGLNKQFGNIVIGGELSVSGADIAGSQQGCMTSFLGPIDDKCSARINWLVTALAKVGYAYDRWLVTGSAGWSIAGADYTYDVGAFAVPLFAGSTSETLDGFTYGAGLTYALTNEVSLGVEYLHADLKGEGEIISKPLFLMGEGERQFDLDIWRAQINLKLGP